MLFLHCEILTFILESSLSKYTSDSKRKCKYQTWALTSCPAERWDVGILHVMVEGAAGDELVVNFFKVVHFKPFHYNLSIKYPFFFSKNVENMVPTGRPRRRIYILYKRSTWSSYLQQTDQKIWSFALEMYFLSCSLLYFLLGGLCSVSISK